MPLGGALKERGLAGSAGTAVRAFLRPEVSEPQPEPPAVAAPATSSEPRPAPAAPAPPREIKQEPLPPRADRAPAKPAAAPAVFYDPSQLTERPKPLTEPPLELLHSLLARPGTVQLRLSIDESGNVVAVDIDSATLPQAIAERAAGIFSTLRFSPGRVDGVAVKTRVRITVGAEERK